MTCRKTIPSPEDLIRAEKQVLAGIYSRLLARYITEFPERFASFLAMAVTKTLLSQTADDEREKRFQEENGDQIRQQINALKDDSDIRRMITDTLVIKVVFQQRKGGCKAEESLSPLEKLKELGLYLEGSHPPTPSSFIRLASRFFSETPLRTSNPPSTSC